MEFVKRNYSDIVAALRWLVLYFGYVIIYLWTLENTASMEYFSRAFVVTLLPLLLLVFATAMEYIAPYRRAWLKPDMNSVNNILFMVINNYGETFGKTIAFFLLVKMEPMGYTHTIAVFWPSHFPVVFQVLLAILLYDFVYYWYHRISHRIGWLWRLHRLHHSSEKLTAFALFKFNIFDIIIELVLLTAALKMVGVPDKIFWIMIGFMTPATYLSHANFAACIPDWLGWLIINPDNHRVHHSSNPQYYNSNFGGFSLFWDRVFGTYQPAHRVEINEVGVAGHITSKWIWGQFFDFLKR